MSNLYLFTYNTMHLILDVIASIRHPGHPFTLQVLDLVRLEDITVKGSNHNNIAAV